MGMLDGKRIVVTGASRGLGRAFATALAAEGAQVVANGTNAPLLAGVVDEITAAGGAVTGVVGSVADDDMALAIVQTCVDTYGGIDVVVNNAGIVRDRTLMNMTPELFIQILLIGIANGSIIALIALGYTMVYGVMKLINFAHGDLFTYGAYLGMTLLTSFLLHDRLGPALGVVVLALLVVGLVAVLGAILERAAYRPLRESPRLSAVVSALGASIFLQNALMLVYGARYQVYPDGILPQLAVSLGVVQVPLMRIVVVVASFVDGLPPGLALPNRRAEGGVLGAGTGQHGEEAATTLMEMGHVLGGGELAVGDVEEVTAAGQFAEQFPGPLMRAVVGGVAALDAELHGHGAVA